MRRQPIRFVRISAAVVVGFLPHRLSILRQAMFVQPAVGFAPGSALVAKQIAVGLVIMSYVWVVGIPIADNPTLVSCVAKEVSIDDVRFGSACRILVFGVESA